MLSENDTQTDVIILSFSSIRFSSLPDLSRAPLEIENRSMISIQMWEKNVVFLQSWPQYKLRLANDRRAPHMGTMGYIMKNYPDRTRRRKNDTNHAILVSRFLKMVWTVSESGLAGYLFSEMQKAEVALVNIFSGGALGLGSFSRASSIDEDDEHDAIDLVEKVATFLVLCIGLQFGIMALIGEFILPPKFTLSVPRKKQSLQDIIVV